jgi:hypothetical protein
MNGYDIIGDVHGCASKLRGLLEVLGYREHRGAYRHSERQAIFVGDLIDRGSEQVETVELVRSMIDVGAARMTMGNHEFNAIAFVTPNPAVPGDFMRTHHGEKGQKHRAQHKNFLLQIGADSARHRAYIKWFKTLPLWLDLDGLRVVHACWHQPSIATLDASAGRHDPMSDDFVIEATTKGTTLYEAVEVALKGPELDLGAHRIFVDMDGHARSAARIRWWDRSADTLRKLAEIPAGSKTPDKQPFPPLPDDPSPAAERYRYNGDIPVFFGHYWFEDAPKPAGAKTACLDYRAVTGGPLVAYRWDGEDAPMAAHFITYGGK